MDLMWTAPARRDMERLVEFLEEANPGAAARIVQALVAAPARLLEHPRIGEKLEEYSPREIRRILIRQYELRYEVRGTTLYVLRVWHTREDR